MRRWAQVAHIAYDVSLITVGTVLVALALDWFLVPNRIAAGGVSGLAIIIYHWLNLPVGALTVALNLPLLILAVVVLGWQSALKTVIGAFLVGVFTDALVPWVQPLTRDPLLAAVSGGLLAGVGMGLSFRAGGSTGGTDVAAQLLQRKSRRQGVGTYLLIADGFVLLLAGIAFTPELALYALVALLASSVVIDMVLEGVPYARQALIITESGRAQAIAAAVFSRLERGVTAMSGKGMYTQNERCILLVVVARGELRTLTDLVAEVDPSAFVIVSDIRSVLGEGFEERERRRYLSSKGS